MAVHGHDAVARAQTRDGGWAARLDAADSRIKIRPDSGAADGTELAILRFRRQRRRASLTVANVVDAQRRSAVHPDGEAHVVEVIDRLAGDGNDAVAGQESRARRRLAGRDLAE